MGKPISDDRLWEIIEPPLPPPKRRRKLYPGRKPIGHRQALSAILFVLKTGLAWELLPQELGWGSGMTAWRRLHAWQQQGVRAKIHAAMLAHLQQVDPIDGSRGDFELASKSNHTENWRRSEPPESYHFSAFCAQPFPFELKAD